MCRLHTCIFLLVVFPYNPSLQASLWYGSKTFFVWAKTRSVFRKHSNFPSSIYFLSQDTRGSSSRKKTPLLFFCRFEGRTLRRPFSNVFSADFLPQAHPRKRRFAILPISKQLEYSNPESAAGFSSLEPHSPSQDCSFLRNGYPGSNLFGKLSNLLRSSVSISLLVFSGQKMMEVVNTSRSAQVSLFLGR